MKSESREGAMERTFAFLSVGQPVFVSGLAGIITRFTPERWGDQIHIEVNGIELPYHINDFISGIISTVAPEGADQL